MSETTPEPVPTTPVNAAGTPSDSAAALVAGLSANPVTPLANAAATTLAAPVPLAAPSDSAATDDTPPRHVPIAEHAEERRKRQLAETELQTMREQTPRVVAEQLRTYLVALHGIDAEDARLFLNGGDPETVIKQAERLVARTGGTAIVSVTPKPDPSQGAHDVSALNGDGLTQALARAVGAS